jgi:hypothetical protein
MQIYVKELRMYAKLNNSGAFALFVAWSQKL